MIDEPDWVAAIPDERDREALRAVLRRRAMEPLFDSPPLCERCGHPIEDHSVFGSEPDPAVLARVTEARFPGLVTSGLYCPHLDMAEP
jgi:hypothetical protein